MNSAVMLTKTQEYVFEHEWRVWDLRGQVNLKYNKGDLTGLIFGYLMPKEDRNLLAYLAKKSHPSVILYEAIEIGDCLKIIPFEEK